MRILVLELNCPLVCLDTETTGVYRRIDRIVQIALIRLEPDGRQIEWSTYVNPRIPIPPEATRAHNITDAMVVNAPFFCDIAARLQDELTMVDFMGYNLDFDLTIIQEEFKRCGFDPNRFMNGRIVDPLDIYREKDPRTLSAAAEKYVGVKHDGAHEAMADVRMTLRVLEGQLATYPDLPRDVQGIHTRYQELIRNEDWVDPEGKLVWRYNEVALNFGEFAGKRLRVVRPRYLQWVAGHKSDFSALVKQAARDALAGNYWKRPEAS